MEKISVVLVTRKTRAHLGTGGIELSAAQLRSKVECNYFVSDKVLSRCQIGRDRHVRGATVHCMFRISTCIFADIRGMQGTTRAIETRYALMFC